MKKQFIFIFAYIFFLISQGNCCDNAYEEIEYPLAETVSEEEIDFLLEYAESHLLNHQYQEAQDFYNQALTLINSEEDSQKMRFLRGLLGSILTDACLGNENALSEIEQLCNALSSLQCTNADALGNQFLANGEPILGPDEISIQDCLSMVDNTMKFTKDILAFAPVSSTWKINIIAGLHLAEIKANSCCRSGGIWKACLQPLLTKWIQLKDWDKECRKVGDWYYLPPLN